MSEQNAWKQLKKELDLRRWAHDRIENRAGMGTPDVNIHVPSVGDVWAELKFVARLERNGKIDLGLRREQYNWLCAAQRAGRRVKLVARVGVNWYEWATEPGWLVAKSGVVEWTKLVNHSIVYRDIDSMLRKWQS